MTKSDIREGKVHANGDITVKKNPFKSFYFSFFFVNVAAAELCSGGVFSSTGLRPRAQVK